jgi:hypothetical protein
MMLLRGTGVPGRGLIVVVQAGQCIAYLVVEGGHHGVALVSADLGLEVCDVALEAVSLEAVAAVHGQAGCLDGGFEFAVE